MGKRKRAEMKSWVIRVRYEFEGEIVVDAKTAEDALIQVGQAGIEGGGEMINWEAMGEPRENV